MQRRKPIRKDGHEWWQCPTCKEYLLAYSFYKSKKTWNGITSQCKDCHTKGNIRTRDNDNVKKLNREHMRRARKANPEKFRARERVYSKKRPRDIRYYARQMVHIAVKGGFMAKPLKCEKCKKKKKLTGHHEDYTKPLNVEWLCYECHGNR